MTGFALVAGVIGVFFLAGLAMGVLLVTVLGGSRRRGARRYRESYDWSALPPPPRDEKPPWWHGR